MNGCKRFGFIRLADVASDLVGNVLLLRRFWLALVFLFFANVTLAYTILRFVGPTVAGYAGILQAYVLDLVGSGNSAGLGTLPVVTNVINRFLGLILLGVVVWIVQESLRGHEPTGR